MAGDLIGQWELFDLMEATSPRIQKNLGELRDGVVSLNWTVQPWSPKGGKPSPEAQRRARLVEELLWNMEPQPDADENEFEDTVRDLMDARGKGIAVLEVDWQPRETSFGPAFGPRATRWVHPRHYGYGTDASGQDRLMLRSAECGVRNAEFGVRSRGSAERGVRSAELSPFPAHKFLIGVCKAKSGHPLGAALLRVLGFWWAAANFTADWFLNFAQLFGQPIRWASYDPNLSPADHDTLKAMLEKMGTAAWAMFPAGTTLELKEATQNGRDNPQLALLNFVDKLCDLVILRQTLTSDVGNSGSRALGDVHERVLAGVKLGCAHWVARNLNAQLIRSICLLNFGDTRECPYLEPALPVEEDPKANAERDVLLLNAGVPLGKEWLYNRHQVPMPGPRDEVFVGRTAPTPADESAPGNPNSEIRDPKQTRNPNSEMRAGSSELPNSQFAIRNPQSPLPTP